MSDEKENTRDNEYTRAIDRINLEWANADDTNNNHFTLYGEINAESCQITAMTLREMARRSGKECVITVDVCSSGGEVTAGLYLYDQIIAIQNKGPRVEINVRGEACSMAAVLLQAGSVRRMGQNALLMLHRAGGGTVGNITEMEDDIATTKLLESILIRLLASRSSKDEAYFRKLVSRRKDLWLSATEALDLGLIDEIG